MSRDVGSFNVNRVGPNSGLWYQAPVSAYSVVDQNTIKIICTVPQGASVINENIKEIYIFAKNQIGTEFLFALGQPTETIRYDKDGSTSLELQMSLVNLDLTSLIVFNNTQATELAEHETDPNAHPEIVKAMAKHGIFIPAGAYPFNRRGQSIEYPVQFDGTKASFTYSGITFSSTYNGNENNSKTITFDGVKTVDQLRAEFNALNYPNTVEHNGLGNEVLPASVRTLGGGSYLVDDKDFVYKDVDGIYKQALADGSVKSRVAGWVIRDEKLIVTGQLIDFNSGFPINTPIYLSGSQPGKVTNFNTNVKLGLSLGDSLIFTGFAGEITASVSQEFDAVVTDAVGVGQYSTTQAAIDAIPNNGKILISKLEEVKSIIDTSAKDFTVVFNNPISGWKRFLGQSTKFKLIFSQVPDHGTFRFEWQGQESNDIPFSANASLIETEFNLFNGHNGVSVSGDFLNGFTIEFLDNQTYPLPTFNYAGRNEIQSFTFSAVPNNGTFKLNFKGEDTVNYAFNDSLAQFQEMLDNLSTTKEVLVSGDFATGFVIEFTGGYLLDGNQEQPLIKAVTNYFFNSGVQVAINGQTLPPIDANRVQSGKKPASNLYFNNELQTITAQYVQLGEEPGPDRLMDVNNESLYIYGNGLVEGFEEGFNLSSLNKKFQFQGSFLNTERPFLSYEKLPGVDTDIEALGFHKDVFAQLRITEHTTNKKRVVVSGVDFKLATGITLTKEISGFKAKFEGAEIDFSNGIIYQRDGVTPTGMTFTPPVITPTNYKWFSINLATGATDPVTNESELTIIVTEAPNEGLTKDTSPKAYYGDNPVGQVAIRGALGNKEITVITTVKDEVTHRLAGKTILLYHPLEVVAFYVDGMGVPPLALTADRAVPVTIPLDSFQAQVAQIFNAVIDADPSFESTVVGNKITVTNSILGQVPDADMGDTGFFSDITQKGTNTDATGIEDIENCDIIQLSTGSGSGSGGLGDADDFTENLKHRLNTSFYEEAISINFAKEKDTYLEPSSNVIYDTPTKSMLFELAGNFLLTENLLSAEFLSSSNILREMEIHAQWYEDSVDEFAITTVAIDGQTFNPLVMNRISNSGRFIGTILNPTTVTGLLYSQDSYNLNVELNNSSNLDIKAMFSVTGKVFVQELQCFIEKIGNPLGYYTVSIHKDDSGSLGDKVYSFVEMCSGLDLGSNEKIIQDSSTILTEGDYWLVIATDASYKSSFVAGTNSISVFSHNSLGMYYIVNGFKYDLRLKVESSVNDVKIKAVGALYNLLPSVYESDSLVEYVYFNGSTNQRQFNLTKFFPNERLKVYDIYAGQVYAYPSFSINGRTVSFPENTFLSTEDIALRFDMQGNGGIDYSDINANILATNFLGSDDPQTDRSQDGRGIKLRNANGDLREIWLDEYDQINVTTVKD